MALKREPQRLLIYIGVILIEFDMEKSNDVS